MALFFARPFLKLSGEVIAALAAWRSINFRGLPVGGPSKAMGYAALHPSLYVWQIDAVLQTGGRRGLPIRLLMRQSGLWGFWRGGDSPGRAGGCGG